MCIYLNLLHILSDVIRPRGGAQKPGLVSPLFMMADYKSPEDVETAQRHSDSLGER